MEIETKEVNEILKYEWKNPKDMNIHLLKYLAFCIIAVLFYSCNDSESKLLEPKVYFENKETRLSIDDQKEMSYDLQSRVSTLCSSSVKVSYTIADASAVEEYNRKNGTNYEAFDPSNVKMKSTASTIVEGEVYAEKTSLQLSNLNTIKEGKSYLLPIRVESSSLPVITGTDITYLIISKPVRILKVCKFKSNYVKVPIPTTTLFKSLTYEALIYIDYLGDNNTIMGCEGILILRIGDLALPDGHNDWIQISGSKMFHSTQAFETGKWYHVAFSYDQPSGKAAIFINGTKVAESTWDTPSFDLSRYGGGFFIGKVAGFMWGERPFWGAMSEVRLWNTSRTENQIKQNMLSVDPKSDGLAAYYKLNGEDQFQKDGKWYIKDASEHNMDGLSNGGSNSLNFISLDKPVEIK